ncbi:Lcl C-terminal domain-containing protein [Pseudoalteromonas rubra]|uniref:Lcl C-terminal domain-containing protein n=1 Tax=Pseudoalteromonas rubra TaxID=43658 RepID=A0A0U3IDC7_9GAMM|nr:DUF1566 domain-containing protein [Pseudoalteromonas rubra]ALU46111.1 hypothetical protein AT705_24425 [Pseudoalteromonas rubra]
MKRMTLTLTLLLTCYAPLSAAQSCKPDQILPTQPEGQFLDNGDGTVTDIVNGLMWTKCSLGQTYVDGECQGTPTNYTTWQSALVAASRNQTYAQKGQWRLPNIKELGSLVERSCVAPAINLGTFPSTPSAAYWSNTFDADQVNQAAGIKGRIVDFTDGTEFLTDVSLHRLVRMVRDLTAQ